MHRKLEEAILYIERNPKLVRSITSFPYIVKSFLSGMGISDMKDPPDVTVTRLMRSHARLRRRRPAD